MKKTILTILSTLLITASAFANARNDAKRNIVNYADNGKFNVLIIGDSISIGYTPFVVEELSDIANISKIIGNGRATVHALERTKNSTKIKDHIGDKKWDLIHFNFGLHDLCYRNPETTNSGKRDKENGAQDVKIEDYGNNLQQIIDVLKTTNAKLIFATTTYVPEGEVGRNPEDAIKYNKVATEVMQKNAITIDPLYDISIDIHRKYGLGDTKYSEGKKDVVGNVHYSPEGYKELSKQVSQYIRDALNGIKK